MLYCFILHIQFVSNTQPSDEPIPMHRDFLNVKRFRRLQQLLVVVEGLDGGGVQVGGEQRLVEVVGQVDALGQVVFVVDADLL